MWDYQNAIRRAAVLGLRQWLGGALLVVGTILVIVNALLLARGAARWGAEGWERTSYGIVAAAVPLVITVTPILVVMMWTYRHRLAALVCSALWAVLIVYNFIGTTGAIAAQRDEVISARFHEADTMKAARAQRERLAKEYDDIPKHRPVDTVIAELAREKTSFRWENTEQCKDVRRGVEMRFCQGIAKLEAELGAAKAAGEIRGKLATVDAQITHKGPVAQTADWSAAVLANLTGLSEEWLSKVALPISTPIVLELLCMVTFWYGFIFFGGHGILADRPLPANFAATAPNQANERRLVPEAPKGPGSFLTVLAPPVPSRQRELAEWFFRECARPHPSGSLPERQWYQHYTQVCVRQGDVPMGLEHFRWFAQKYVEMIEVEGITYYRGSMPFMPREVA